MSKTFVYLSVISACAASAVSTDTQAREKWVFWAKMPLDRDAPCFLFSHDTWKEWTRSLARSATGICACTSKILGGI